MSYFQQNFHVHNYDTLIAQQYHIPQVKPDGAKTGIKYRGAVAWNAIKRDDADINAWEIVFKKVLKRLISVGFL